MFCRKCSNKCGKCAEIDHVRAIFPLRSRLRLAGSPLRGEWNGLNKMWEFDDLQGRGLELLAGGLFVGPSPCDDVEGERLFRFLPVAIRKCKRRLDLFSEAIRTVSLEAGLPPGSKDGSGQLTYVSRRRFTITMPLSSPSTLTQVRDLCALLAAEARAIGRARAGS
jgi:hypothetical protein